MRQVNRLLTRELQSDMGDGKLVAIQGLRDTDEMINSLLSVLYQRKPSEVITRIRL